MHRHKFKPIAVNVLAKWTKQEGQGNDFLCTGTIESCGCGTYRIVPDNKSLMIVEVDFIH